MMGNALKISVLMLLPLFLVGCRGERRLSDPSLLAPADDSMLIDMANKAAPQYRESKLRALRAAEEKSSAISDAPVSLELSGVGRFRVPMNYISPWGNSKLELGERKSYRFYMFLPFFFGYDRKNFLDQLNPDIVDVSIYARAAGRGIAVEQEMQNILESGFAERNVNMDQFGLMAYSGQDPDRVDFTARNDSGELMHFNCSKNQFNDLCKIDYLTSHGYYLYYVFSALHLKNWKLIDLNVVKKIESWRLP